MNKYLFPTLLTLLVLLVPTFSFAQTSGLKIISDGVVTLKVGENNTVNFNGGSGNVTAVVTLKSFLRNDHFTHWTKTFNCSGSSCTIFVPYNINVGTMVNDEYPKRTSDIKVCDAAKKCDTVFVKLVKGEPLITGSAESVSATGQVLSIGDTLALNEDIKVKLNINPSLKNLPQYKGGNVYIRIYNYSNDRYSNVIVSDKYTVHKAINGASTLEFTIPASAVRSFTKEEMTNRYTSIVDRVALVAGLKDFCQPLSFSRPNGGWQMEVGCETVIKDMKFFRRIDSEFGLNSNDSVQIGSLNRFLQRYDYTQSLPVIVDRFTSETEAALKAFQAKVGIAQTGKTDVATRAKLAPLLDVEKIDVSFVANKETISGTDRTLQFDLKTAFNTSAAGFRIDCKSTPTLTIEDELGQEYCNRDVWRDYSGTSFKLNLSVWYDSAVVKEPVVIVPIVHLADKNKRIAKYELAKREITIVPNPVIDLIVTAPTPGEVYSSGDNITVRWSSQAKNIDTVTVSIMDTSNREVAILGTAPFKNGYAQFKVPVMRSASYTVRVAAGTNSASSRMFSVRSAFIADTTDQGTSIIVTSPNGGETFAPGQVININWTAVGIYSATKVTLTHVPDGVNSIVIGEALASAGTFAWKIPASASGIKNTVGVTIKETPIRTWDTSDKPFTISNDVTPATPTPLTPTLTLTTPNGGESFKSGENIPVRWTSNAKNIDKVAISLAYTNGTVLHTLATPSFKNGLANVVVQTPGTYKIIITAGALTDSSDGNFMVNAREVTPPVVTPPKTPAIPKQDIPNSPLSPTTINGQTFYESFGGVTPEVSSISRTSASTGDTITIMGSNFTSSGNSIYIDTLKGNQWSVDANATDGGTKLTFKVGAWQPGWYYVYVFNENGQSNFKGLYIKKPAGANVFRALWDLLF